MSEKADFSLFLSAHYRGARGDAPKSNEQLAMNKVRGLWMM